MLFLSIQEGLTLSSPLLHRWIIHQILLDDCLRVLHVIDIVILKLLEFLFDVGTSQESVVFQVLVLLRVVALNHHGGLLSGSRRIRGLDSTDGNLEQLIFPLGIKCLLMKELLLFDFGLVPLFPELNIFLELEQFLLIVNRILSQLVNGQLQISNTSFLEVLVLILILKRCNEHPQLLLFLLNVNIVGLQVLVLLPPEHFAELGVKLRDFCIYLFLMLLESIEAIALPPVHCGTQIFKSTRSKKSRVRIQKITILVTYFFLLGDSTSLDAPGGPPVVALAFSTLIWTCLALSASA